MNKYLSKLYDKLVFKQWVIGICHGSIEDIILNKNFKNTIKWLKIKSFNKFYADPFLIPTNNGTIKILFEEFKLKENYGKISLLTLNNNFKKINKKIVLDTKSHLSYPFIFRESNKCYVFPEAAKSGKLSCYEYDTSKEEVKFVKDILNLPLLDTTFLKYNDKYWLFGTMGSYTSVYKLYIFFSNNLLGPYSPHMLNPVKTGLDAVRSAGSFIKVNGEIYMPTQNCAKDYGDSMTLHRIIKLTENEIATEEYMTISIQKNKSNYRMNSIHTINVMNDLIVVDGQRWIISLSNLFLKYSQKIIFFLQKKNKIR